MGCVPLLTSFSKFRKIIKNIKLQNEFTIHNTVVQPLGITVHIDLYTKYYI